MKITCPECGHEWEAKVTRKEKETLCPSCGSTVSLSYKPKKIRGNGKKKPSPDSGKQKIKYVDDDGVRELSFSGGNEQPPGYVDEKEVKDAAASSRRFAQIVMVSHWVFRTVAGLLGFIVVMSASARLPSPAEIPGEGWFSTYMPDFYYKAGFADSVFALIAGLCLLLLVFSSRTVMRAFSFLGVLILLFGSVIIAVANLGPAGGKTVLWIGFILATGSFIISLFKKLTGNNF